MAAIAELQNRVDTLEALLRERERKEAQDKAAAIAAQQATDAAKDAAERTAAAIAERERIRVGAHLNYLLGQQPADASVDLASLQSQVPPTGWPPGTDESLFVFTGGTVKPEADVSTTTLGKALAGLTRTI